MSRFGSNQNLFGTIKTYQKTEMATPNKHFFFCLLETPNKHLNEPFGPSSIVWYMKSQTTKSKDVL